MGWARFLLFLPARRTWGLLLLGAWLIVSGLQKFVSIPVASLDTILAATAIAAGVLIMLDR